MNKQWTLGEEQFIRENSGKMTDREMLEKIRIINPKHVINLAALRKKRQRLFIHK